MSAVVSVKDVANELDALMDGATAYLHRRTGELFTMSDDMKQLQEDDTDPEELPPWQREIPPKLREVIESEDYLPLPTKFDIHEYAIMERFFRSLDDAATRDELLNAIRGRGAFRYFKDIIHCRGIQESWYRYRDAALERIVINWLEEHGIAYKRG